MARTCVFCEKNATKAASRSHSKVKTLRRQKPNLQKIDGINICTRCMRTVAKHQLTGQEA